MIQVGEFSFVLAQLSLRAGVITGYTYSMILGSAVITMILTPFVFALTSKICVRRREVMQVATGGKEELAIEPPTLTNHVVICGHGRVGSSVAWFLAELAIPYMDIKVLHEAGIKDATALVLAIPDPVAIRLALDHARRINPNLDIIARAHSDSELEFLQKRGVSETVQPETEAGIEIVRHLLCRLNIPEAAVVELISSRRKTCSM